MRARLLVVATTTATPTADESVLEAETETEPEPGTAGHNAGGTTLVDGKEQKKDKSGRGKMNTPRPHRATQREHEEEEAKGGLRTRSRLCARVFPAFPSTIF